MEAQQLSSEDYAALMALLPPLYDLRDIGELAPVLLRTTAQLIPNFMCTYNEMNFATGAVIAAFHPESMRGPMEAAMPDLHLTVMEHPIYQRAFSLGEGHPQFFSDYYTPEEAEANPFGRVAKERLGVVDHLLFSLQNPHQRWIFIAVSRQQRDFTERDRIMATLLRKHFIVAYDNAVAFTEAKAKSILLDRLMDSAPHGIVLLDHAGRVLHMNNAVCALLERYFPSVHGWQATLPPPIAHWLQEQAADSFAPLEPYSLLQDGSRLVARVSRLEDGRRIILARELEVQDGPRQLQALGLTDRQAEVLYWTCEGKSNSEISIILSISARTVEKHLEAVYQKVHAENRTSAMLIGHQALRQGVEKLKT